MQTACISSAWSSSAANVGTDKDSEKRQRHAIQGFAKRAGFEIVDEFYDAAVSGADPIETRAGFAALLDRIEPHGELRPEAVALAKRLHRASPKTGRRMSLRKIGAALTAAGHLNERGQPFNPKSIVAMVAQKT